MPGSMLRRLALGLVLCSVVSAPAAQGAGGWTKVAAGGFGNRNNSYFPESATFRGYLYVATISSPAGTVYSGSKKLGAEIWRTRDGASWQRVVKPGFGDRDNLAIRLALFDHRLYAITTNAKDGFGVWASSDGVAFRRLAAPGFGSAGRDDAQPFVFNGRLLLGVSHPPLGAEIWASDDGDHFREVARGGLGDRGNTAIEVIRFNDGAESRVEPVLDGALYVGTANPTSGGEVWRTRDGISWKRVADRGLGRRANVGISPRVAFAGQVYALTTGFVGQNSLGVDIYRSAGGSSWKKVVDSGFNAAPHRNTSGFLAIFKNELYLVTSAEDPRVLIPSRPAERFALHGFELRRSTDGVSWQRIGKEGFGSATSMLATLAPSGDLLYLSATDYRNGGSVWRTSDGQRWTRIFVEPKASLFNEGLDTLPYDKHLFVFSNDLTAGASIWRSNFAVAGSRLGGATATTTQATSTSATTTTSTESTQPPGQGKAGGGSSLGWLIAAGLGGALVASLAVFFGLRRSRGGAARAESALPRLPAEPSATAAQAARFCAGCGKELAADARFCPHCGRPREAG
ncbi:MAG: zinc-ribbon domain-containing protein [Gaiellaceae bacterium]